MDRSARAAAQAAALHAAQGLHRSVDKADEVIELVDHLGIDGVYRWGGFAGWHDRAEVGDLPSAGCVAHAMPLSL